MLLFPTGQQLWAQAADQCGAGDESGEQGNGSSATGDSVNWPIVAARDPNEIVGPAGYDTVHWVSVHDTLTYIIFFENDPDFATAPAQVVEIYLPLDDKMNPYSFRMKDFGFGSFNFQAPSQNGTFFSTNLDVSDSLGVLVDVVAGIDIQQNRLFWRFESLDPQTGLEPLDPLSGFLPVNDSLTQKGEGYVSFTILPAPAAQTGDTIFAQAEIIFDINPPLLTNTYTNQIDALPPTLSIAPIPGVVQDSFVVSATFADDPGGSGTRDYDLFLSIEGEPLILLAQNIWQDTSLSFRGQNGKQHCLYSLAQDNVTNIQAMTTSPHACFLVRDTAYVNLLQPLGGEQYCLGDTVHILWEEENASRLDLLYSSDGGNNFVSLADSIESGGGSYPWILEAGLVPGNYLLKVVSTAEDSIFDILNQSVTILTSPDPIIAGDSLACEGDSIVLTTVDSYSSYVWSDGSTEDSLWVRTAGNYQVLVTGLNGCSSPLSEAFSVSFSPIPPQPEIIALSNDSLRANFPADSFLWYVDGMLLSPMSQTIKASASGAYAVIALVNGCPSPLSDTLIITVTGIPPRAFAGGEIQVYPNPNRGIFLIEGGILQVSSVQISLYNLQGQILQQFTVATPDGNLYETIETRLPSGTYFVVLEAGRERLIQQVLIQR